MQRFLTPMMILALALSLGLAGCSDDGDENSQDLTSEFEGYTDYDQVEYTNATSAFLGPAHQGDNPDYARAIYASNSSKTEGDYVEGDIFVKETYTFDSEGNKSYPESMGLLGMIKREAGFDTDGGDWEYFIINPDDLSTVDSGADLGSCKGCHTNATGDDGNDHIFAHPYEYMAANADFNDYADWNIIGTENGPDALLGPAHEGNNEDAVRKIYKKQLQANASAGDWAGFPTGTLYLKTVEDVDGNIIGKTGMAKRGGGFDGDHGNWEYFMMDMESQEMMPMGEGSSMCIGCHTAATVAVNGMDYVFAHEDDPFNN